MAVPLNLGDTYQWWVRAVSSTGATSPWSSGDTFTAVSFPPPALIGPGGAIATLQPNLTWTAVTGADHYDLWVNDLTTGTSQVIRNPIVSTATFTPSSALTYGHMYRFWVRAVDALGDPSDWSLGLNHRA